jgi:D-alanyl-D-alanine carboxypeptidase (penicillin-binding protein 5/6)
MTRLLLTLALACVAVAARAATFDVPPPPAIGAGAYILIDHDSGRVLAELNADQRMEPASITKLMTAYVVFSAIREKRIALTDQAPISEVAWRGGGATSGGSTTFLEVGSRVPVETLLKGMIIQSGNDASVALAEFVGGTEEGFAVMMNQAAKELGLKGSSFRNSTGLPDPEHYMTAADIARLGSALVREFPEYYRWYSEKEFTFNGITQGNRNGLLFRDPTVDGMKTGFTESAGYCLVTSALRDGMRLISVVLRTASPRERERASETLLAYGFRFYETKKLYAPGQAVQNVRVWKGAVDNVDLGVARPLVATLPRGATDTLATQLELPTQVLAPLSTAVEVGRLRVTLGTETVAEAPLVPLVEVPEGSLWQVARDSALLWFE